MPTLLAGSHKRLSLMRGSILPYFYIFLFIFGLTSIHVNKLGVAHIKRQKEKELIFVGEQYIMAIERYYQVQKTYPKKLELLIKDPRFVSKRYLRKRYDDPVTLTNDWGLLYSDEGGIAGIYSRSESVPIKKSGFDIKFVGFDNARSYQDWKFQYVPVKK